MSPRTTFLVGASGVGKSALAREIERSFSSVQCLHFDEIIGELGFWAADEAEAWQRRATLEWCRRIALLPAAHVVLDGQTRYTFAAEGCAAAAIEQWRMVLVHCAPEERRARLRARGEPELDDLSMQRWAEWLLRDARERGLPVFDTTGQSLEASCEQLAALLQLEPK